MSLQSKYLACLGSLPISCSFSRGLKMTKKATQTHLGPSKVPLRNMVPNSTKKKLVENIQDSTNFSNLLIQGSRWPGFLINRSGLPFDDLTWNELWEFAGYLYPEAKNTLREIQTAPLLQDVPFPYPPTISVAKQGLFHIFFKQIIICKLLNR